MKVRLDIFRKKPGTSSSFRQGFEIEARPGMVLLEAFHTIQEETDPSFAYRYSCRGAICGSCAVRINGAAALACKTQIMPLADKGTIVVDPLANMAVIKDLVCEFTPFWEAYDKVRPYLVRDEERHDDRLTWEDKMTVPQLDQLKRCIDCIKCGACFSDCPKRAADSAFIGPAACVQFYKFYFDPRDADHAWRDRFAGVPGSVLDCESHANCVKVCPKDVRPLRAINFIRKEIGTR
jgi:succinate dehydrogenase / fumarate reductase iron-sulfur subunit